MNCTKLLFGCFLICLIYQSNVHAQPWMKDALETGQFNFYDIQKKAQQYWMEHDSLEKGKGFKPWKRWEWYWEPRVYPTGEFPTAGFTQEQFDLFVKNSKAQDRSVPTVANWTTLGPNSSGGGYAGIGRLNSIGFHPTNTNTIYAGAAGGGFWKTTDGGTNWTPTLDTWGSLGVSAIVTDASNANLVYIATGDGDAADTYSIGVLKSTDAGATWATTGLTWTTSQQRLIRRMIMDPDNNSALLAATSNGVYRTLDAGVTWSQVQVGNFYDIEANPVGSTNIFYASTASQIYKSSDNGATWSSIKSFTGIERVAIATAPSNSNYVYALLSLTSNSGFGGLHRSTDNGANFTQQSTTPNIFGWAANGSDSGGQGWYDLCLTVDPTNADVIYTGGVNIWKSTNGGVNWTLKSHWSGASGVTTVHADHHALEWQGTTTLFDGNDGGIYKTVNGGTSWTFHAGNLIISQMYRLGVSTTDSKVITGLQDNGSKIRSTTGTWTDVIGGDGMECFIDRTNSNTMYGELYNGAFRRSTNGGGSWSNIVTGLSGSAAWVTPWQQDPSVANTLWAGYVQMFKSTNQGTNWTAVSGSITGTSTIYDFEVAPSNNSFVYVIKSNTLYKTTDGGATWSNVTGTIPTGSASMVEVRVSHHDPNVVFVSMSGYSSGNKVFKSINGGSTWTNISGTLPNMPANAIAYSPCTQDGIYVGMDVGVYYRDNTLSDWVLYSDQLPNVAIGELEVKASTGKIYAATFGRGLWISDLYASTPRIQITASTIVQPDCAGNTGSITLNIINVPNGTHNMTYKKNGTLTNTTQNITSGSTTISGLGAGNYTEFTIAYNGCTGFLAGPIELNGGGSTPTVDPVSNKTACGLGTVAAINFTGTPPGVTFSWTNNNTNIGLGASGNGNIPAFTTPDVTSQQVATITVTPTFGPCTGTPITFTITVNTRPIINVIPPTATLNCLDTLPIEVVETILAKNYGFNAHGGVFNLLTGATSVPSIQTDDAVSSAIPIGFNFKFEGNTYSNVYASSNGWLSFNSQAGTATPAQQRENENYATTPASMLPLIAPLWDNLNGNTGTAKYLTTGSAPNRVFTFEWNLWKWDFTSPDSVISFQVKLYETLDSIAFIYQPGPTKQNAPSASIGLMTSSTNFKMLDGTGPAPNASSTTFTTNLLLKPANGQVFKFTRDRSNYLWSPVNDLYTNSGATIPYVSQNIPIVYTVPKAPRTYFATATTINNCSAQDTSIISLNNTRLDLSQTFIEGYMTEINMRPVLMNQGVPGATSSQCDTITVELHNSTAPYALAYSSKVVLKTNGTAVVTFPFAAFGNSYYIVIKGRNMIETWSKNPQSLAVNAYITYHFGAATQAYGNNMGNVGGTAVFYSGDFNFNPGGDGSVDLLDYPVWETGYNNFDCGFKAADLNGDGCIDLIDYPFWEGNYNFFIGVIKP